MVKPPTAAPKRVAPPGGAPAPTAKSARMSLKRVREALAVPDAHEQALVFRELSVMLRAGIPITRALHLVKGSIRTAALKEALEVALQAVQAGAALSHGMSLRAEAFSPVALELVRVGEGTGSLDKVLDRLATWFEGRLAARQKVRAALTYPLMVAALSLAVLVVVPAFLMDGIFGMLADLKVEIPLATRLLMAFSAAVRSPLTWLLLALVAGGAVWGYTVAMRDRARRLVRDRWILRVKGVGPCLRLAAVTSFSSSLEVAIEAGVPLMRGLRLAARGSGNLALEEAVEEAIRAVEQGASLAEGLRLSGFFPPSMLRMLAAGEESGSVVAMLGRYRKMAEADLEAALEVAVAALEPAVLLTMGLVVGFMALSMMAPLLKAMEAMAL